MSFRPKEVVTVSVRLIAFAVTIVPLAALLLPWVTLDGSAKTHTGVTCIALLVSPIRSYLYEVDPIQTIILTVGPVLIVLLPIVTSNHYYKRKSIIWAPPIMLAIALAFIYLTTDLIIAMHEGPYLVAAVAILLILHQAAIRVQVATRRNRKLSWISRPLAIATGIEERRRWS